MVCTSSLKRRGAIQTDNEIQGGWKAGWGQLGVKCCESALGRDFATLRDEETGKAEWRATLCGEAILLVQRGGANACAST